jgi:hypothetical protein
MTAHVTRLAGAILLEYAGQFYLIGNTKQPCDWQQAGFEPPVEIDAVKQAFLELSPTHVVINKQQSLLVDPAISGNELAQVLANRFLIRRNGSVSERLWRIVTGESDESSNAIEEQNKNITWLVTMPEQIWDIVRDAALKCL